MQKSLIITFIFMRCLQVGCFSLGYRENKYANTVLAVREQCRNVLTNNAGLIVVPAFKASKNVQRTSSLTCRIHVDKAEAIHMMFRQERKTNGITNHNVDNVFNVTMYDIKASPSNLPLDEWNSVEGSGMRVLHRNEIWLVVIYKQKETEKQDDIYLLISYAAQIGSFIPGCDIFKLDLPANGIIISKNIQTFGSVVNLQCLEGYIHEGDDEYAVCSVVGDVISWIKSGSGCSSICNHPPQVQHATTHIYKNSEGGNKYALNYTKDGRISAETNANAFYICHEPFVANGLMSLECGYDLFGVPRWFGSPPSCLIPDCSATIILQKLSGSLVNPAYPSRHLSGGSLTCSWEISGSDDSYIHIDIIEIDLPGIPGVEIVFIDNTSTRSHQLLKLTNESRPVEIDLKTSKLTVTYHGPPNVVEGHRGFYIRYLIKPRGSRHRRNIPIFVGNNPQLALADSLPPETSQARSTPPSNRAAVTTSPGVMIDVSLPVKKHSSDTTTDMTKPASSESNLSSTGSSTSDTTIPTVLTPTMSTGVSTHPDTHSPTNFSTEQFTEYPTSPSMTAAHQTTVLSTHQPTESSTEQSTSHSTVLPSEPTTVQLNGTSTEESAITSTEHSTGHASENSTTEQSNDTSTVQSTITPEEPTTGQSNDSSTEQPTFTSTEQSTENFSEESTAQLINQSTNYPTNQQSDTRSELSSTITPETPLFNSTLPQNTTVPAASGEPNDDWKIAVGVIIPILFLILVLVGIYICYRKKYPIRMIIGREFAKFSNPNYGQRAHAPTLVREDADFYFTNGSTLSMPSEEFNPVNSKIMYDNVGFIRDDCTDEDENERKFLQRKSWLFKKTPSEPQTSVETIAETTIESSFISKSLSAAREDSDEEKSGKRTYTDNDIVEVLVEKNPNPTPKPRLKKKIRSDSNTSSSTCQSNGQLGASKKSNISRELPNVLGSSLTRGNGLQGNNSQQNINEPKNNDHINIYFKDPMNLFHNPSFDQVWAEVKARSRSLSIEYTSDSRSRSLSFDPSKSARKMSLHDDLQAFPTSDSHKFPFVNSDRNNKVTASVVAADIRDRDSSFVSSVIASDDSDKSVSEVRKESCKSISSLNSDSYLVTDFVENESQCIESLKNTDETNNIEHEASIIGSNSRDGENRTKMSVLLQTVNEDSTSDTTTSLESANLKDIDYTDHTATEYLPLNESFDKHHLSAAEMLSGSEKVYSASNEEEEEAVASYPIRSSSTSKLADINKQFEQDGENVPEYNGDSHGDEQRQQLFFSIRKSPSTSESLIGSSEISPGGSTDEEKEETSHTFPESLKNDKKVGKDNGDDNEQSVVILSANPVKPSAPLHLQTNLTDDFLRFQEPEYSNNSSLNISKLQFSDSSSDSSDISPSKGVLLLSMSPPNHTHTRGEDNNSTSRNIDNVANKSSTDEYTEVDDKATRDSTTTYKLEGDDLPDSDIDV